MSPGHATSCPVEGSRFVGPEASFLAPTATSQVQKDERLGWGNMGLLFIGSHSCSQAGAYISQ